MARLKKNLKLVYYSTAILMVAGILMGPLFWYSSYQFHQAYEAFKKGSTIIEGQVVAKRSESGFRLNTFYVTIRYQHQNEVFVSEIAIEALLWDHLHVLQTVDLWYNPLQEDLIKIKMENEPPFLPPILTKGLGKWISICSYALLVLQVIFKHRINTYFNLEAKPTQDLNTR